MTIRYFFLIIAACLILNFQAFSQERPPFTFSGYGELYYSFDFDNPGNHLKPFFLYNHKRHNEVNLNLAYARVNYTTAKIRSNLGLMAGNILNITSHQSLKFFRFIYEANIGVKISEKYNLWLNAGIMPSHIGFESNVSADCWTVSRSMVAENSPYYETGIKLTSTTKNEKLFVSVLLLNGWQRIQRPDGINTPSFGMQVNYKPKPDSLHALRIYHNFYAVYQLNDKWGVIAGVDIGRDKNPDDVYALWYSPVLIIRKNVTKNTTLAFRTEYFNDKDQVLLVTDTPNGFKTFGLSLNCDYAITKSAMVRLEGKGYFSKDKIFNESKENNNYSVLVVMSLKL